MLAAALPIKSSKSSFFKGLDYSARKTCSHTESSSLMDYSTFVIDEYQSSRKFNAEDDGVLTKEYLQKSDGSSDLWSAVADTLQKSPQECIARHSSLHSNTDAWNDEEQLKLLKIIETIGPYNWPIIAEMLGTNRTPVDCLRVYRKSYIHNATKNNEWSKEEDLILNEAVSKFGTDSWQVVSQQLPGRTSVQCMNRHRKSLECQQQITSGRWTETEERQLFIAAVLYNIPTLASSRVVDPSRQGGKLFSIE
jgi:hypothetical protein